MGRLIKRVGSLPWLDYLLISLFLIFFREAIFYIWSTFTSKEFYENGVAFIVVTLIFIYSLWLQKARFNKTTKINNAIIPLTLFLTTLFLYLLNMFILQISIIPAIVFLLGVYSLFGFYLESVVWRRSIFIFIILIMTLPLLERVQKFLGFPIRLLTANVVSGILQFLGIGNASQSTIIITENRATSIDLPCSGVKSIYTGGLFLLTTYYLQNVKLSIKLLVLSLVFFIILIFFNVWRVFSLVYVYDVLNLQEVGDSIHLIIGISGFIISCFLLWYAASRFLPKFSLNTKSFLEKTYSGNSIKIAILILLCVSLFIQHFTPSAQKVNSEIVKQNKEFTLNDIALKNLPFSDREQSFFVNSDVTFSKKYTGETKDGIPFTLLLVSSKSARTHHDPETCLLGLGYKINNSEIFKINDLTVRRLSLNENNAHLIYWFVSKDKNILDYSERVWEEIRNPNKEWMLIEIGFAQPVDLKNNNIADLISQINSSAKRLL